MGLHRLPDPATAPGAAFSAEPAPACGAWYEDGWISPYLRLSLPALPPAIPLRLRLGLYCPGSETEPMPVLLRAGCDRILLDAAVPPGELCRWELALPPPAGSGNRDLLLRTGRIALAGEGDLRRLGLVMTDCTLTAAPAGQSPPAHNDDDPAEKDRIAPT